MALANQHHRFTVDEYLHYFATSNLKTELVNGEIIDMSPVGLSHARTQNKIHQLLQKAVTPDCVYTTGSVRIDDQNLLEPDVFVFKAPPTGDAYPTADQLDLVVEVSVTTLKSDLLNDGTGKLAAYATARIPQVWVVDVASRVIHVFTQPTAGFYNQSSRQIDTITYQGQSTSVVALLG